MRKLSYALAATVLVLGLAGGAQAINLGFTGAVAVQIATLDPVAIPGSGSATINGTGGPGHLTGLVVEASPFAIDGFVLPVTDPGVFPIAAVAVTGGVRLPGRWTAAGWTAQRLDGRDVRTRMRMSGRVSLVRSAWLFPAGGPLGYLTGRTPLVSFTMKDMRLTFGQDR